MKVLDVLSSATICVELKGTTKEEVIAELCELLRKNSRINDIEGVKAALMEREELGSTGIGQGVAIPHARCHSLTEMSAALGISKKGIDFGSLDGEPVYVVFLLVAPPDSSGQHLKTLARISRLLKDKFFRQTLKEAKTTEEIEKIIREEDEY